MKAFRRFSLVFLLLFCACPVAADAGPPTVGGELPDIVLNALEDTGDMNYLGVSGKGTFRIPDITARLVIIEIFSMY